MGCRKLGRAVIIAAAALAFLHASKAQTLQDLRDMSVSELSEIDVSSVTKGSIPLNRAPAAVYVITHDDIVKSGATNLPQILRLAPNLEVDQVTAQQFVVTARGFNGNQRFQSFANNLLVLVDGRSVYSPLYSGVYWDQVDVVPDNIERIEVISGPAGTLWGANAVNGVVNIITRNAADTQGASVTVAGGNLDRSATARYGGAIGDSLYYRAYVRDCVAGNTEPAAHDHWSRPQGGFRLDWFAGVHDTVMLEGDVHRGEEATPLGPDQDIDGRDLLARWKHSWDDGSETRVLAYYDHSGRGNGTIGNFWVDTFNLEAQDNFRVDAHNEIVWGGGIRSSRYRINGSATFYFVPPGRNLDLAEAFAQDTVSIFPNLSAIVGLKLEDDPYSGFAPMPNFRLSWAPDANTLLWASISRAIRAPTPFDADVQERNAARSLVLVGNPHFQATTLTAYELGIRMHPVPRLSFSLSLYDNHYNSLRSIESGSTTPFQWGNEVRADTYGAELWGNFEAAPWWRLSASFDALNERFHYKPDATLTVLPAGQDANDAHDRADVRSSMNLGPDYNFDTELRYVSSQPRPHVPAYVELNASAGWNLSERLRLSLAGFNLLHPRHIEYAGGNAIPRSFSLELQCRF